MRQEEEDPFDNPDLSTFALIVLSEVVALAIIGRIGWELGGHIWRWLQ
jgi:hypothetical protein